METPVVSTRCGGPEEIIKDGATGLLVKVKDNVDMAKAIIHLLNDPPFASNIGVAGRQDVLSRFSEKQYISGIQQVIEDTI
jgi:glycosyltransferase involved in cell wall biosynthesis